MQSRMAYRLCSVSTKKAKAPLQPSAGVLQLFQQATPASLDQMQQNLAVTAAGENTSLLLQLFPQLAGVGDLSVVHGRQAAHLGTHKQRLNILPFAAPSGGIPHMPHCVFPSQLRQFLRRQRFRHQAVALPAAYGIPVADRNSGALLSPVLEGVQPQIGQIGGTRKVINAENAALLV